MTMVKRISARTSLVAAIACFSGLLSAQPAGGQQGPTPPQEALDACISVSSGKACSFTSLHGTVKGTCVAPEGRSLSCRPTDAPNDQPQPPKK